MAIRELRTFLAVAEGGSFAAASRQVGRTQSAVTVQMKALEDEFGVTLFDRSKRPPSLSAAGRAFLPHAIEAVAAYDRLFQVASDALVEGHLRLGVVPSVITGLMPRALKDLRERYPALHVELAMGLSKDLVGRVQRGVLDAAVVSDFTLTDSGLRWSPYAREPLILIAPTDMPGRKAEELLESQPFIRYSRQAWVGQLIDDFLKRRNFKVREIMALDTLEAIRTMVHHGLGVSVVPQRAGEDPSELPVRTLRFSGTPAHRVVGVVQTEGHTKTALVNVLLDVLKQEAGVVAQVRRRPRAGQGTALA
ncbi:LysR family transcriptional regulator [Methylobacterium nodulans]|uniref:Transcriptional regulator, LysR family n=1 Tax=Methylobacterium nodulans (strain LMG 21967 / CNCM I-2342 / ORS 2060) TaxID=460265 RepID=B8IWF0_METNO|nr:LysR family transcriptional regulator [Methylobacterium nodulans]ACL62740.1 transcriptional regulator, LysR family [Methylobacterium nodulans ORS 2060]